MISKVLKAIKAQLKVELIAKSIVSFVVRTFGAFAGYVFLYLVTNESGAAAWGSFSIYLASLHIFSIISKLGTDLAIVRFISEYRVADKLNEVQNYYLTSLIVCVVSSIFISIILYLLGEFRMLPEIYQSGAPGLYTWISYSILPFTVISVNAQNFRGLKDILSFTAYNRLLKFVFALLLYLVLLYFYSRYSDISAILAFAIGLWIIMFISLIHAFSKIITNKLKFEFRIKSLLKRSLPMLLTTSAFLLMTWTDTLLIGFFKTNEDVGIYNIAIRVATILAFVMEAINSISAPKISETYNSGDMGAFRLIVKQITNLIFICTLPLLLLILLFSKPIILFFGSQFLVADQCLYILILGQASCLFCGSVGNVLQMTGGEKIFQRILVVAFLINLILNILLIPNYGIEGAAFASCLSMVFWNIASVISIKRKYGVLTIFSFGK